MNKDSKIRVYDEQLTFEEGKERFLSILNVIQRPGVDKLVDYLERTDFFTAPSSAKFHNAFQHGLLFHSLGVHRALVELATTHAPGEFSEETLAIVGLLHDLCKIGFYKLEPRNRKIDGEWRQVLEYVVDDKLPLGHGEKSVILIQRFFELNGHEALAINWHMGSFDNRASSYIGSSQLSQAMAECHLVPLLHAADLLTSSIYESQGATTK